MPNNNQFSFAISLSVLNHLGRNLYRSVATVLGEAISNSWDANAENVHIYIDKGRNSFFIKDDGDGMTADDFQNKFLKIGYSKRKEGNNSPDKNRPYIGRIRDRKASPSVMLRKNRHYFEGKRSRLYWGCHR